MNVKNQKFKLYLEGIEVPFISMAIQETIGRPVTANITFPAVQELMYLLPKTMAHVFGYLDNSYKLIFEGSLESQAIQKTAGTKNVSLGFSSITEEFERTFLQASDVNFKNLNEGYFLILNSNKVWYGRSGTGGESEWDFNDPPEQDGSLSDSTSSKHSWYFSNSSLINNITTVLKANLVNKGNLLKTFYDDPESFLKVIESYNPYFKLTAESLNFFNRIYVSENSKALGILQNQETRDYVTKSVERMLPTTPVSHALSVVLGLVHYDKIDVGAPTWDPSEEKLYQVVFKPNTDYFLPISCNIFYPNQIGEINYQRSMKNESTRIMFEADPVILAARPASDVAVNIYHYTAPMLDLIRDDDNKPVMKWTYEERYRGVNPKTSRISQILPETDPNDVTSSGNKNIQFSDPNFVGSEAAEFEVQGGRDFKQAVVTKKFFDERYRQRHLIISTDYNPYRLVGFPGLILEENLPSIYGTVGAITTHISSNGQARQSIVIQSPKFVEDSTNNALDEVNRENSVTGVFDSIPNFPDFYDINYYGVSKIGKGFYKNLSIGENPDGNKLLGLAEDDAPDDDFSIYPEAIFENPDTSEGIVGVIKNAATYLKKNWKASKNSNYAKIEAKSKRTLISEQEFWKFLNIEESNDSNFPFFDEVGSSENIGYKNIEDINIKNDGTLDTDKLSGYPFIDKRAEMVKRLGLSINSINVRSSHGLDYSG